MIDTILHILLGTIVALVFWQLAGLLPDPIAFASMGAFVVYHREVTQRQSRHGLSFTQGWLAWKWGSTQKIIETVVPVAVLIIGGTLIHACN